MFRIGGNANFSVFSYKHVGIPDAKLWRSGFEPTPGPNANGFASLWNIGFRCLSFTYGIFRRTLYIYKQYRSTCDWQIQRAFQ